MGAMKFSESISINGDTNQIFDYTQDYNNRLAWDSFLIQADLLEGAVKAEKGVKAWCVARNGLGMETQYVSFNRPKVTAIKMTKGPYIFKDFAASWIFSEQNESASIVTFTYSFRLRFPYNLVGVLIRTILQRNVRQRLVDLKKNIEQI
jgi:hypothetical protein